VFHADELKAKTLKIEPLCKLKKDII